MKVIYTKDIPGVAKKGDIKEVSDGYFKNFLVPKSAALSATSPEGKKALQQIHSQNESKAKALEKTQAFKAQMETKRFTVHANVGATGQIFGSVKPKEVIEVVNKKMGTDYEASQLENAHQLKSLGEHQIHLNLGSGVKAKLTIVIEPK